MSRRVLINLVFFMGVFALMLYWAVNNIVTIDAIERPYTIYGEFDQTAGVSEDSEVTYLGVNYGRVSTVERHPGGVRIGMKIDRDKEIPAGSTARIFRKSAIGEPYVDFFPPEPFVEGEFMEEGETVEKTTVPLEFSELLRSAGALVGSIEPDAVGSLVHELALALDGRGQDLRDLTTSFDTLATAFASRTEQLDRLAENNTRLTRVLADHRLSIGRSLENLRAVGESLRASRGDLQVLLENGPQFLQRTADLVADQKRNLDCLLTDLAPVLRMAASPERVEDLATLLRDGPTGFGLIFSALDREPDGAWIRVRLLLPIETLPAPEAPHYPDYPRALPVVPTVSACASTLEPAGITPAEAGRGGGGAAGAGTASDASSGSGAGGDRGAAPDVLDAPRDLARTGGRPLAALAFLLAAAAAVGIQTQRRGLPGPRRGTR